jgi:histidinol-phosphate/aromatic aminotransferase/cobyric acid decarboxylase-like protein
MKLTSKEAIEKAVQEEEYYRPNATFNTNLANRVLEDMQEEVDKLMIYADHKFNEVEKLEQQLAEKDKDVRSLNILAGERHDSIVDLAYQLTAAKVKITRLEQINCDLELALKNL